MTRWSAHKIFLYDWTWPTIDSMWATYVPFWNTLAKQSVLWMATKRPKKGCFRNLVTAINYVWSLVTVVMTTFYGKLKFTHFCCCWCCYCYYRRCFCCCCCCCRCYCYCCPRCHCRCCCSSLPLSLPLLLSLSLSLVLLLLLFSLSADTKKMWPLVTRSIV